MEADPKAQLFVEERENEVEEEDELELGLSLGANNLAGGKNNSNNYGGGCRILTAKDLAASRGSRASPTSSVSSSYGSKRFADAGSDNTPSPVVGWPPIRTFRINNLVHQSKEDASNFEAITDKNNQNSSNDNDCINTKIQQQRIGNVGITRFVKVKMDGDPIGRKVDLNAHQSYETLALALELMFHISSSPYSTKASKLLDSFSEFALTYEDKEGDWMLAGDVPWGMFLDTVKRLRIMRTSDSNGLATRFQSSTGGPLRYKPV